MSENDSHASEGGRPLLSKSLLTISLEAILISAGVFLGLLGDQWRENADRREVAEGALRRFREEIVANRERVAAVQEYHVDLKEGIDAYLASDAEARRSAGVQVRGLQPVIFEGNAWDLALATQALADIDPDLALALSRIYTIQRTYEGLTASVTEAMHVLVPTNQGPEVIFRLASLYYGDIVLMEPRLLTMYDSIVPQIGRVLAE